MYQYLSLAPDKAGLCAFLMYIATIGSRKSKMLLVITGGRTRDPNHPGQINALPHSHRPTTHSCNEHVIKP